MSLLKAIGGASGSVAPKLDASEVFSTYLRTGTGADIVTTTGIDMTQGYMLWSKSRSIASDHALYDSSRGLTKDLVSNSTAAETTQATGLKAVSTIGHTIGSLAKMNTNGATYVDQVWREAPKFFHQVLKVHTTGAASTVDLSTLGAVGMVTVKSTVNTGNWFTWHRSLTAGNNLKLNLTDAESVTNAYLSVSGTTLTIASTAPSDTYIVYAWAHDTSADGIIQCGSFTENGSSQLINLGWEPQYLMMKLSSGAENWFTIDSMRGFTTDGNSQILCPNLTQTEIPLSNTWTPTATGFKANPYGGSGVTYIYMAIRRPNKVPTSGTEVYNAIARTGTGTAATVSGVGFAPDFVLTCNRPSGYYFGVNDRLRGKLNVLRTALTNAEVTSWTDVLTSFDMDGFTCGADVSGGTINVNAQGYINHFFKRAKGFFDIVCWTNSSNTNQRMLHNLGVVPELIITKTRDIAGNWYTYAGIVTSQYQYIQLSGAYAVATNGTMLWGTSAPTISDFGINNTATGTGYTTATQVAYLFATLAGISKIGSYTGNGATQTINCGFTGGARFILIKRTDSTGDWYIWDTARGIVAGNDPHLSLNTTAAEVTTDDTIDPEVTGFIVNQVAATNVNVTSATYIYFSIS